MFEAISSFAQWLIDLLLWVPLKVFESLMEGLAELVEALPVPEFMFQAASAFSGISGNVLYFASKFAIAEGLAIYLSALTLRFIIRRIPFFG